MKREWISKALGDLDDRFIEEAAEKLPVKKSTIRFTRRLLPLAACLVLLIFTVIRSSQPSVPTKPQTQEDAVSLHERPPVTAISPSHNGLTTQKGDMPNEIKTTDTPVPLSSMPNLSYQLFSLPQEEFCPLSQQELLDYFSVSFSPPAETNLQLTQTKEPIGVYQNQSGEIYFDSSSFLYTDKKQQKKLTLTLSKAIKPVGFYEGDTAQPITYTRINGRPLTVFSYHEQNDFFLFCQFLNYDTAYSVLAQGLSTYEFTQCLQAMADASASPYQGIFRGTVTVFDPQRQSFSLTDSQGFTLSFGCPFPAEQDDFPLDSALTVSFHGEPATQLQVWPSQIQSVTSEKGKLFFR